MALNEIDQERYNIPYLINHVFLPPKLPQRADNDVDDGNASLLKVSLNAAMEYRDALAFSNDVAGYEKLKITVRMIAAMSELESSNSLPKIPFGRALKHMATGDTIALHVSAQNAGILIQQLQGETIFSSFEASPKAADVIASKGKLLCSYPGPAISVGNDVIKDDAFVSVLASFLDKMKRDTLSIANERGIKAGTAISEERETSHPKFITEMLTGVLRAVGKPAEVKRIQKRIADDVLWNNADIPWRRSPFWLVIRVSLQLTLDDPDSGNHDYKVFLAFVMAKIVGMAVAEESSSDLLFVMNAKLSRRVLKLEGNVPQFVFRECERVCHLVYRTINSRWATEKAHHSRSLHWRPDTLEFERDTVLSMQTTRRHLSEVVQFTKGSTQREKTFRPSESQRIGGNNAAIMPSLEKLNGIVHRDNILADFEHWVDINLESWMQTHDTQEETIAVLGSRIDRYVSAAKQHYASNPEMTSVMILTTLELWIALDRVATDRCRLFFDYFPMLGASALKSLLLPRSRQIDRIRKIQKYLDTRSGEATISGDPIFSEVTTQSFSVRYFDQTPALQDLRTRILNQARKERHDKAVEFMELKRKYEDLLDFAQEKEHDRFTHWTEGWTRHDFKCRKCALIRQARGMKIEIHEWPLPEEELQSKAVVFELRCPLLFSVWRDATRKVLCEVGERPEPTQSAPREYLNTYSELKEFFQDSHATYCQNLRWASFTKSFLNTHYRTIRSTSSHEEIFLSHGLCYRLFDVDKKEWIEGAGDTDILPVCTYRLPEGPYKKLQYSIRTTTCAPNKVIANQSDAGEGLSSHEYLAFGLLRAGSRLQWRNILRELRNRTLTFSSEAVGMLLMQCAWQVGPLNPTGRLYHMDLEDDGFGNLLISEIQRILESIEGNWQEATTLHNIAVLAIQLAGSRNAPESSVRALQFLRHARRVSLKWTRELANGLPNCSSEEMRDAQARVVQLAATCRATYNVDHHQLLDILSSEDDIAVLVECATMIHQNAPAVVNSSSLYRQSHALLVRDQRLALSIEDRLRSLILSNGFDIDLKSIWSGYRRGSAWECLPQPNERWLVTRTASDGEKQSHEVHYNILSGELLVGGLPIGQIPAMYTSHQTYRELFDGKVLDVFPSTMPGMAFETKHPISGYEVNFAMGNMGLVIRTKRLSDTAVHQLIPRHILREDFPKHIVDDHYHWFEISTGTIELRSHTDPWSPKFPHGWYISDAYGSPRHAILHLGAEERLIDIRSPTTEMINRLLGPLEYGNNIDIRLSTRDGLVTAHLPRLKIDFILRDGDLTWKQFPGMVVDDNQDIGTLIGLENRLVLRQGVARTVIIPHGKVTFKPCKTHVSVDIDTKGLRRVRYSAYTIDPILSRLVGNGSLVSHLYRCYLHAVTSCCFPDSLTKKTGTEEAISGLRAGATWSFQTLDTKGEVAELFRLIADLTPKRVYYPRSMRYMQQVTWSCLSPLSQHDAFHSIVDEVSNHASRFYIFHEGFQNAQQAKFYTSSSEAELLQKAAVRNAYYRTQEFGGSLSDFSEDDIYRSRHTAKKSEMEARVCHVASLVKSPPAKFTVSQNLSEILEGWRNLRGIGSDDLPPIGYDSRWLNEGLEENWCMLYDKLTGEPSAYHKYQLMFLLCTLAVTGDVGLEMIGTLLAIATIPEFRDIKIPNYVEYRLSEGYAPDKDGLLRAVKDCVMESGETFELVDEIEEEWFEGESIPMVSLRVQLPLARKKELNLQSRALVSDLLSQWPCDTPTIPQGDFTLLEVYDAWERICPFFKTCYRNMLFQQHVERVQSILDRVSAAEDASYSRYSFKTWKRKANTFPARCSIRLQDLFNHRSVPNLPKPPPVTRNESENKDTILVQKGSPGDEQELHALLANFQSRRKGFFIDYAEGLEKSLRALGSEQESTDLGPKLTGAPEDSDLRTYQKACENHLNQITDCFDAALGPQQPDEEMCFKAGLWPRASRIGLLEQLSSTSKASCNLPLAWKDALVEYGIATAMLQRAERLLQLTEVSDIMRELDNLGHQNWDPSERADWLLMEIESNILIRPVQADIALVMISPPENKNTIVQLLMGEGKTSVVTPIVAAALADGDILVRVVVLKPLSAQMYQTLVQRLGGILNRRVFFMPFSRSVKMGLEEAELVRSLFEECRRTRGILLAQPEHILSFKLLGLEWLFNAKSKRGKKKELAVNTKFDEVAEILVDCQSWLEKSSRDILDESDEILNVRHELIYSIGTPSTIQNAPDRWVVIQEIFGLLKDHFLEGDFNMNHYEVGKTENHAQFPLIRILQTSAGLSLMKKVASKIVSDGLPSISFRFLSAAKRRLAEEFMTNRDMTKHDGEELLDYCGQRENDISAATLYLLRGLFARMIMFFVFREKRWKVDYGLDLHRTMLAVPYRAKDSPAGRAEFSHPDVAITLTCLSYYYGGLNNKQLYYCFRSLYKADNPTMLYEGWTKGVAGLARSLQTLSGINLDDRRQWDEILRIFRYNKAVIDFYLAQVVFPKEAKEFKDKLSTSGWDIAGEKTHPTTGFSGTNDNRYLLPISIDQLDRPAQLSTNARVLKYLLQPENSYVPVDDARHERLNFENILTILTAEELEGKPVRVLLDVGAQVLELANEQVARKWLHSTENQDVEAAVYFNDLDVLTVLTRDEIKEPLLVSSFAQKLEKCLVYLDEVHTRGTDLKLPPSTRGAVTLGPGMTKDRLVQACMRLRKLGHGHSVLFCAPLEIQSKLQGKARKEKREDIQARDVITWCMEQSCFTHRKLVPIWAKQGIGYQKRIVAWTKLCKSKLKLFPEDALEKEAKSLKEHYGFESANTNHLFEYCPAKQYRRAQFKKIEEICSTADVKSFRGAHMLEEQEQEQERELYHEIECERENQRAPRVHPVDHVFSNILEEFVWTGKLPKAHPYFVPAFSILGSTSAKGCDVTEWSPESRSQALLATMDFARVIHSQHKETDNYLRPVNWIGSSLVDPTVLLILSPYEVNRLLPSIKRSTKIILHMYSPRITKDMPSFEDLLFCPTPAPPMPWSFSLSMADQLNIFAGQLYFKDYQTYERVCGFLALCLHEVGPRHVECIATDGFVERKDRKELGLRGYSPFSKSMVVPLRALMGIRRKGHTYLATHMGQILHGRQLTTDDF